MKVLISIPHVFAPKKDSLYSSENESKRTTKQTALEQTTIGNLCRHSYLHWIHASLGKGKSIVTRELQTQCGVDLTIQLYTPPEETLADRLPSNSKLEIVNPNVNNYTDIPLIASRRVLEQAEEYDLIGYMEDDLLIEDPEFFAKINYLEKSTDGSYAFLPHRCERMPNKGDVILSGDPDGGRPDLFWDTKESISFAWPLGKRTFYRATNPHSGCFFLSKRQALMVANFWKAKNWKADYVLSGPLETACSGILLPLLKLMKPIPTHYRFLSIIHQDSLWKRHSFEKK